MERSRLSQAVCLVIATAVFSGSATVVSAQVPLTQPATSVAAERSPAQPARLVSLFSARALDRLVREQQRGPERVLQLQTTAVAAARKDSFLDGGLIGAAVGGVGGSFLLVVAAGGSDDFRGAMLQVSPLTALAGFGVGAAIDALR